MALIKPTVGRVVLVFDRPHAHTEQPEAALITYVHNDQLINVGGFDANGHPFQLTSLYLVQSDKDHSEGMQRAEWMPYQKGQAAKTEQLESQIKAGGSD